MKLRIFLLAAMVLLGLAACKQEEPNSAARGPSPAIGERMQMAPFKMTSLTDETVLDSRELEGQVLLVNFFATWCPPCIQEIPTLISLQDTFKGKGFSVVAFSVDEGNLATLKKIIDKNKINYPVLRADPVVTRSFGGVTGIPVTFLVNRQGQIVKKFLGYTDQDTLAQEIKALLASG